MGNGCSKRRKAGIGRKGEKFGGSACKAIKLYFISTLPKGNKAQINISKS